MPERVRRWSWVLVVGGIATVVLATQPQRVDLMGVGGVVVGLGLALWGLSGIVTREVLVEDFEEEETQTFRGTGAVLQGVLWLLVGLVVIVVGAAFAIGAV